MNLMSIFCFKVELNQYNKANKQVKILTPLWQMSYNHYSNYNTSDNKTST